jgi:hypothetical protein
MTDMTGQTNLRIHAKVCRGENLLTFPQKWKPGTGPPSSSSFGRLWCVRVCGVVVYKNTPDDAKIPRSAPTTIGCFWYSLDQISKLLLFREGTKITKTQSKLSLEILRFGVAR